MTDILNRQEGSQASKRQRVARPKPDPIGLQHQDNLLELNSATNPSPKLTTNPHLDLDELEKQAIAFQKQPLQQTLRDNLGGEESMASFPDYIDASQVLRKMSGVY